MGRDRSFRRAGLPAPEEHYGNVSTSPGRIVGPSRWFARSIRQELDYRHEARNADGFYRNFAGHQRK